ncbi:hypothetical protein ACFWJT_15740 [Streptomyces sp. NPDC127069]
MPASAEELLAEAKELRELADSAEAQGMTGLALLCRAEAAACEKAATEAC